MASKKNKKNVANKQQSKQTAQSQAPQPEKAPQKQAGAKKKDVKKQPKEKKVAKKFKEVTSELKKVSWPSFGKVVKSTGVVLAVVVICTVILLGIDTLLKYGLYDLIMPKS